jgi:hypothetical protein
MCAFHAGLHGIDRNQFAFFKARPNFECNTPRDVMQGS